MICPNCQAEYRKGFTTCSDCNVPLVEELPELPKEAPDEASEIRDSAQSMIFVAADAVEAETVKGLLEASGIAVNLANESSPFPGVPGLASGLKLVVNSAQESLARRVLDEYRVSAIGPSDAQEDTSAFEPECGLPEEVEGDTESSELGELCPNCRTQRSSADTSCPECGQELSEARSSDTAATSNNEAACVGTFRSREADFRDIFVSDRGERTAPVLDAEAASICPTCGAHYRAGFSMCSDCKVPLQLLRRFVFPETSGK